MRSNFIRVVGLNSLEHPQHVIVKESRNSPMSLGYKVRHEMHINIRVGGWELSLITLLEGSCITANDNKRIAMEAAGIIGIVIGATLDIVSARVEITAVLKKIERIEHGLGQHFAHIRPGHLDYDSFRAEADDIRKYIRYLRSMIGCGDRHGPSGGYWVKWAFMNKAGVLMMIEDLEFRYQGLERFRVSHSRRVEVKKVTPDSELRAFSPRYRAALIKAHLMYSTQSDTAFCVSLGV